MNPATWMMRRVRGLLRRRALEREMQEEMAGHLEQAAERFRARGLPADQAREAARREFGNVALLQEEAREARGFRWLHDIGTDLRFAVRHFRRHTATAVLIVAVLALGTAANTIIFSMLQANFFRPAPAVPADPAHVRLWAEERATPTARFTPRGFTFPELQALAGRRAVFHDLAAWTDDDVILDAGDSTGARSLHAQFVTPNYFTTLGVPVAAGRSFLPGTGGATADAPELAAVLSTPLAALLYGTPSAAVGRTVRINEVAVLVVGVAAPRFQGAIRNMDDAALWLPVSARAELARLSPSWLNDAAVLALFARLAPGATRAQATALTQQVVTATLPDSATRVGMTRRAEVLALQALPPDPESTEMVLAVSFVTLIGVVILLVAWMNVSSLMVAAAVGRRHEIAVRLSLGASRWRLLRQLLTESTLLALAGSALGLLLAWWELSYMARTEVEGVDLAPDLGTFAFVAGMALATGILFGLSPALHATRGAVANALRDSGAGAGTASGGRARLQRGFVVAQIALSQPLLVLLATMLSLVLAGYQPLTPAMSRHVITADVRPLATAGTPGQGQEAVDSLLRRIAERPDVVSAVPEARGFALRGIVPPGTPVQGTAGARPTIVHLEGAAPGWFTLLDVPIVLGRDVALADSLAEEPPVVIGSDLARALWGGTNPVGQVLASPPLPGSGQDSVRLTVIGVYDATRPTTRGAPSAAAMGGTPTYRVYTAHGQQWRRDRLLVRTRGPAAPVVPELQRFVRTVAPSLPVSSMLTLAQADAEQSREAFRVALLAGAGGLLALLLASLGLYGVVSLAVRQRTREIGIRIAVGAVPMAVARMFLASGVRVSALALLLGLPLSIAALKFGLAQGLIFAIPVNPYVIGGLIAALQLGVASAATWIPARRAARVAPATTLRVE